LSLFEQEQIPAEDRRWWIERIKKAQEEQENADLLFIMESGDERAKGVLTGKIFEYMVSGRPVISLGSTHDSAIGRLIYETGIGAVCEQDVSKIKNCLLKLVLGNSSTFYQPRLEKIRNYSRERQAGMLIDLINEGLD
jgi:glycosyltransferase involved in cell wall biosynthesis